MKNIFSLIKITLVLLVLFAVLYPLAVYGVAQLAHNNGKGEVLAVNGKVVGYQKIGQKFDQSDYFWGRPSAVDYNAAGSAGSNKGPSNKEYLALVQKRIDTFLMDHPYLKKSQIPADIVTASGSGLDPNISLQAALIQVGRIASARGIDPKRIQKLIDSQLETSVFGPQKINVLQLNIALDNLK